MTGGDCSPFVWIQYDFHLTEIFIQENRWHPILVPNTLLSCLWAYRPLCVWLCLCVTTYCCVFCGLGRACRLSYYILKAPCMRRVIVSALHRALLLLTLTAALSDIHIGFLSSSNLHTALHLSLLHFYWQARHYNEPDCNGLKLF